MPQQLVVSYRFWTSLTVLLLVVTEHFTGIICADRSQPNDIIARKTLVVFGENDYI